MPSGEVQHTDTKSSSSYTNYLKSKSIVKIGLWDRDAIENIKKLHTNCP